jgi:tripartite ATP-independent transporter DctP family solute receptor
MKNKKRGTRNLWLFVGMLAGIALIFSVLPKDARAGQKPIVIKYAHGGPPDPLKLPEQADAMTFKEYVESRSGGRIKVEIYPACQLGSEREMLEGVKIGNIEMANTSEGPVAGFYPEILATAIPYAFKNRRVAWEVMDGPYGQNLAADVLKKTGLRCLDINDNGYRNFTNKVHPVHTPADLKGFKIRTMENPAHMKMVNAMGAIATPIAWAEVYTALQLGTVDGQENPVSLIVAKRFYEVQKYCTLDGHIFSIDFTWINDKFYQSLPPDLKQVVKDGADMSGLVHRGMKILTNALGVDVLKKKGMEVYTPTEKERQMFKDACQGPVIKWIKTKIEPSLVDNFLKAIDEAEKKLAVE